MRCLREWLGSDKHVSHPIRGSRSVLGRSGFGDTWIADLEAGHNAAVQPLWERDFSRMVELARLRLRTARHKDAGSDEEDAALSAFDSLCAGLARGQFPKLADRDDLWRLLVVITTRKVQAQTRRQFRQKRGAGQVRPASELDGYGRDDDDLFAQAVASEPTLEFAAMVAEEYRRLLERLDDDVPRKVAILRIEGYTTDEIGAQLGCARRPVAWELALIRRFLADDCP
jgi:DNA-directed RNA polymerase specialized sigma24 family protein